MAINYESTTHTAEEYIFDENGIIQLIKNIKTGIKNNYDLVSCPQMSTTTIYATDSVEAEIDSVFTGQNNWRTTHLKDLCLINKTYPDTAVSSKRYNWIMPMNLTYNETMPVNSATNIPGTFVINYGTTTSTQVIKIQGFDNDGNFTNQTIPLSPMSITNPNAKSITTNIINADFGNIDNLIMDTLSVTATATINLNSNLLITDTTTAVRPGVSPTPYAKPISYRDIGTPQPETATYNKKVQFASDTYTAGPITYQLIKENPTSGTYNLFISDQSAVKTKGDKIIANTPYKLNDTFYITVEDSTSSNRYVIVAGPKNGADFITNNEFYSATEVDSAPYGFQCRWPASTTFNGTYYTSTALNAQEVVKKEIWYSQDTFYYSTTTIDSPAPGYPGDTSIDPYKMKGSIVTFGGIAAAKEIMGEKVHGAVFNDYAEYRHTDNVEPGHCVIETGKGDLILSTRRLQLGGNIVSDTFGFSIGKTDYANTPIAVGGRVLAIPYENKELFEPGDAVCSGPGGTISRMTREEIQNWPDAIIGYVSEIPQYLVWGSNNVQVNGRIWIKV